MDRLQVENPYTGEVLQELSFASASEIQKKLDQGQAAFHSWRKTPAWKRSEHLEKAASLLQEKASAFAEQLCEEAGKPITLAEGEVQRAIDVLKWSASETLRLGGEILRTDTTPSGRRGWGLSTRFPRGLILGITPFNFPLNLAIHKVGPALASGNTILIKPSPFTPLCTSKILELFPDLPPGVFDVVLSDDSSSAKLTQAQEIRMISFTGSSRIGWMIKQQNPRLPVALELGGNAWTIITEHNSEKDFSKMIQRIIQGSLGYAGQSCISVQNLAIHTKYFEGFSSLLRKAFETQRASDPKKRETLCGPVIHSAAFEKIQKKIKSYLLTQGKTDAGKNLIPPTLIENSKFSDSIVQEEVFGPVLTLHSYKNDEDLQGIINSGLNGLQAGIFTQDLSQIQNWYETLEVGGLVVNDVPTTRYDHQPYGGVKESGNSREGVTYATQEMTEARFLALSGEIH